MFTKMGKFQIRKFFNEIPQTPVRSECYPTKRRCRLLCPPSSHTVPCTLPRGFQKKAFRWNQIRYWSQEPPALAILTGNMRKEGREKALTDLGARSAGAIQGTRPRSRPGLWGLSLWSRTWVSTQTVWDISSQHSTLRTFPEHFPLALTW